MVRSAHPEGVKIEFKISRVHSPFLQLLFKNIDKVDTLCTACYLQSPVNKVERMAYLFILLYYFGMGTSLPLFGVIRARYFGRKSVGSIGGTSAIMMTPFAVIAPIYAGWTYDTTGSYIGAFAIFAVLLAFAGGLMSLIRPPRPPAEVFDIRRIV